MCVAGVISQHDIFVDIDIGPLVNGKVEVYDPVSNNLLNVYTYSDDEYAVVANPLKVLYLYNPFLAYSLNSTSKDCTL